MAHNTLSYASPGRSRDAATVPGWLPLLSIAAAVIPWAALGLKSAALLFVGAPFLVLGFLLATVSLIAGPGAVRALAILAMVLSLPGLAWYGMFFFVGIC